MRIRIVGRAAGAAVLAAGGLGLSSIGLSTARASAPVGCSLGNGVRHVVEVTFDNVHFNRDNPNVPSDVEQLPALKNFIESNGTLLSNNHTPLIAHTAVDSITNYTGLYGDRHGVGISNSYDVYNTSGGVANKSAFAYWTANYGLDAYPNLAYSPTVPAAGSPPKVAPAPWVPFTRAGCNFGAVSTANMVLENTNPDLKNVFGATSPEVQQLDADPDHFKDQETNDYVGVAVHCAQGDAFCGAAQAVKYGQTSPSPTAAPDLLPDEPTPYTGFQALFGHKYIHPQLAAAANSGDNRSVGGHSYPVTDARGNLTDLNGNTMVGEFVQTPGFPGFGGITAAQSLAYVADMQETGVPITFAYISDLHGNNNNLSGCSSPSDALGPGDPCYENQAASYNQAFTTFFQRLADDGITPANTEFIFTADEGDHFAGANVGRALVPSCTGTPGVAIDTAGPGQTPYLCSYPQGTIGEVSTQVHTLLAAQTSDTASFYSQPQGEAVYATDGSNNPATIRQLEHDFAKISMVDPYDGLTPEPVSRWIVDPTAEALLHFVNADPNRTPSFTVFPNPDVFFSQGTGNFEQCAAGPPEVGCNQLNDGFAWNHGYFAPEVNNTWLGVVGPGVADLGLNGVDAAAGPNSAGPSQNGQGQNMQGSGGVWVDHTDVRPTLLSLLGLKDDYVGDGRVLTEVLTNASATTNTGRFLDLATCYKQLNSSVGRFGTDVIQADTAALETGSSTNDSQYQSFSSQLQRLGSARDALAGNIKQELFNAEFSGQSLGSAASRDLAACQFLLGQADQLNGNSQS